MSWSRQGVSTRPRCDELGVFRRATTRYQCCQNEIMQSGMELDDPTIEAAPKAGQFERCDYPFSTYEHPAYEGRLPCATLLLISSTSPISPLRIHMVSTSGAHSSLLLGPAHLNVGLGPEMAQVADGEGDGHAHLGRHHDEAHVPA